MVQSCNHDVSGDEIHCRYTWKKWVPTSCGKRNTVSAKYYDLGGGIYGNRRPISMLRTCISPSDDLVMPSTRSEPCRRKTTTPFWLQHDEQDVVGSDGRPVNHRGTKLKCRRFCVVFDNSYTFTGVVLLMILFSSKARLTPCSGYASSSWLLIFTAALSQSGTVSVATPTPRCISAW